MMKLYNCSLVEDTKELIAIANMAINGKYTADAVKKVIFNDPATIIIWANGTKTVVRCQEGDVYDKKTGLLLCLAKRLFGNEGEFNKVIKKWLDETV
jgi:hypothetical protein